jgi:hypothetical protein
VSAPVTPLEFLQSIYCNEEVPLPVRMRAAIEAAPFVHPKLTVNANFNAGFASRLEAMMTSRGQQPVIDAKPTSARGS